MANTDIQIKFGVSGVSQASVGIQKLTRGVKELGSTALGAAKFGVAALATGVAALGAASVGGAYAMSRGIKSALEYGAQMHKLSNMLGVDAGQVAVLSQAFRENGLEASMISSMLPKMQRKIAENSEAFVRLGISAEALKGKSVVDQFEAIGSAVRGVASQESKMLSLMQIFEEAGPQMMQLFNNSGAFAGARETLGREAEIIKANAAAMERASTLLGNVSVKLRGFFSGVAVGVLDPLLRALEGFNRIDFSAIGEAFGRAVGTPMRAAIQALKDGEFGDFLSLEIAWAASKLKDMLGALFGESGIGRTLINVFVAAGKAGGEAFGLAVSPALWKITKAAGGAIGGAAAGWGTAAYQNVNGDWSTIPPLAAAENAMYEAKSAYNEQPDTSSLARALSAFGKTVAAIPESAKKVLDAESESTARLRVDRDALRSKLIEKSPDMLDRYSPANSGFKAGIDALSAPVKASEISAASATTPAQKTDALARIGGFLGGTNSPATSAAMRTAKNTDRMSASLDTIARLIPRVGGQTQTATYAN